MNFGLIAFKCFSFIFQCKDTLKVTLCSSNQHRPLHSSNPNPNLLTPRTLPSTSSLSIHPTSLSNRCHNQQDKPQSVHHHQGLLVCLLRCNLPNISPLRNRLSSKTPNKGNSFDIYWNMAHDLLV